MQTYIRDLYDDAIRTGYDPAAIVCHPDDVGTIAKLLHIESIPIGYIIPTGSRDRGSFGICQTRTGTMEDAISDDSRFRTFTVALPITGVVPWGAVAQ